MILQYTNDYRKLTEDDLSFLKTIATQIAIAINQSRLFKTMQIKDQNREIIIKITDALKSTIDKKTIKHILVKNIGKFYKANRVFFSDYDASKRTYLSVDAYSEYLSGPNEKSFINFDFSVDSIRECLKPLLEKKELNILNWNEYVQKYPKTIGMISRFQDANVTSSYNLPVIYEQKIMGYFCIEYTHEVNLLSNEDLDLMRNICTQVGIVLYQADLYIKAKESILIEMEFVENMSNKFQTSLSQIIEISKKMSKPTVTRDKQIEYLKTINKSSNMLLNLTNHIIDKFEIEYKNNELYYEEINLTQLIEDIVSLISPSAANKNIKIFINAGKINVNVDWKITARVLFILLTNTIKFTAENGIITIISKLDNGKCVISIKTHSTTIKIDDLNIVSKKIEPDDRDYINKLKSQELPLGIAKELIEVQQGSIEMNLDEKQGTRFWFVLPRAYKID